jgi:drug/metabolite transporter (DMT)-like permease
MSATGAALPPMPVSVVLLVIASALAHASWNAILKRCRDPEHAVVSMMFVAAACGVIFAVTFHTPAPAPASIAWSLAAGLLEAGYFVTLARALSRAPLGSVYTVVRGGALVVVWPISVLLLDEPITLVRGAGTLLVVLGLAATGAGERAPSLDGTSKTRSGIAVAGLCALFVGGYHLAYKLALSTGSRPEAVVSISLSTASILNVSALGARRRLALGALRTQPVRIVVGGLLASVGFLVFLSAMKDAGAGVVLTLRNTSILFAQALSFGLGERPRRLGIVGAGLVTTGAVLLAR